MTSGAPHKTASETTTSIPGITVEGRHAAAAALASGRRAWTDDQVAYLIALAFESGAAWSLEEKATWALEEKLAEVHVTWLHGVERESVVQDLRTERIRDMERAAAKLAEEMGRPGYRYRGGPVDWETGRPVRHLAVAA